MGGGAVDKPPAQSSLESTAKSTAYSTHDTTLADGSCGDSRDILESKATSDIAESKKSLDSKKDNVCVRSGASGDLLSMSDTNLPNCNEILDSIDAFVFYDKPFLKFERLLETYFTTAPRGFFSFLKAIPIWLKDKLFLKETLARELASVYRELYPHKSKAQIKAFKQKVLDNLYFSEHHISHAASAFYPSPFSESAILVMDGVGEWSTTTIAKGCGNDITIHQELHFPHSLGLLYSAFTYYTGFKVNSGEYKVMGLAPYGEPKYVKLIKSHLIDIKDDGSFALDMRYFSYTYGLKMTNAAFDALFAHNQRSPESRLTQAHFDLAASIQVVTEEVMLKLARHALKTTKSKNLALSGGVALNCVGNGKIYKQLKNEGLLENIWIQPASGDAGNALGCALAYYYIEQGKSRGHSVLSDKSGSLIVGGSHYRLGNSFASNLHNPNFSSQSLECPSKPSAESNADSEPRLIDSAIFAEQRSNQNVSHAVHTNAQEISQEKEMTSGEVFFDDFKSYQARGAGSYLSGSDQAECADSLKSAKKTSHEDSMQGSYLGLSYTNTEVESTLKAQGAVYEKHEFATLIEITARALTQGKVIGWHQGRCEFGPRALGARSIIGDPRNTTMQKTMNLKIKYRESFRPFAPSVLAEKLGEWFELDCDSPYMLLVAPVKAEKCYPMSEAEQNLFGIDKLNVVRSEIPSVTHIDYSARIQSVHKQTNPRYYALLQRFYELTSCPVLVNTSFNVRGEPIVCSPKDSFACFMGTEMDMLVIEDFVLYKDAQSAENRARYQNIKDSYELD
ncbi:carbamoyltransferase [uncultured Helicobacter sp.]|uniref:carbamoyltransferase family protein n=1 Tax=uncultured Helicobacter sp. TaxID=175537 RepID=UPI00374E28A4